jgi:hypothetical protein
MSTRSRVRFAALIGVGLLLTGCITLRGMRQVPAERVNVTPPADKAAVVFLRTARTGTTTSLFEIREPQDQFIGLLVSDTRMVYVTTPGRTRFMVVGLTASFLDADLQPGKTYQVAVAQGTSSAAYFELKPVRPGAPPKEVQYCLDYCIWVENTEKSQAWSRAQWSSVQRKKARYLPDWEKRANRPVLVAEDGR